MIDDLRTSYDRVAAEYVGRCFGELDHKPLDRLLLDRFADSVRPWGLACDLGCGPGQVARYLHGRGVRVMGLDLSPVMVETARRLNPGIEFAQGDMHALQFEDEALGGIVACYSIIHIVRPNVVPVLAEMKRVLRSGGQLLLAFHIGDETVHLDEWWGEPVSLDFLFYRPEDMTQSLEQAGFRVVDRFERDPYPGVEHPSRRAYLLAERPLGSGRTNRS
jgi:SAM-dependent methyltransferase